MEFAPVVHSFRSAPGAHAACVDEESAERFAFRHALTREAVYSQLLERERQALHRQIAQALDYMERALAVFSGQAQLPGFVQGFISGIRVDTRNYRADGNSVYFDATVAADAVRQLGVAAADQSDEVVLRGGKVAAFTIHLMPESAAQLNAGAAALMAAQPKGL
jgi:hypothetical protein